MKRRIAAIIVGDIVGYSAMMEKSEEKTVARLTTCQALISDKVASLDGRIFNRAGDATLAEFPSPINALRCAVEIGVALAGVDRSDVPAGAGRIVGSYQSPPWGQARQEECVSASCFEAIVFG